MTTNFITTLRSPKTIIHGNCGLSPEIVGTLNGWVIQKVRDLTAANQLMLSRLHISGQINTMKII